MAAIGPCGAGASDGHRSVAALMSANKAAGAGNRAAILYGKGAGAVVADIQRGVQGGAGAGDRYNAVAARVAADDGDRTAGDDTALFDQKRAASRVANVKLVAIGPSRSGARNGHAAIAARDPSDRALSIG